MGELMASSQGSCVDCLHGNDCDRDECYLHPNYFQQCFWEPKEDSESDLQIKILNFEGEKHILKL